MKKLLFALIAISLLTGCKTEKEDSKMVIDPLPLNAYYQQSDLPAAIMGYGTSKGKMNWYAFGPSVWGGKDTVNENHIFRIYSMTKAIASVAAMQLVEQGSIGLDEPLDKLMPEMTTIPILAENEELVEAKKPITLRHLLTHTAGFGYKFRDPQLQTFDDSEWKYDDYPRLFEAGEKWHYGTSIDWVGKIIEKISNQDLETYLRTNVTGPLKMNSTWFNVPEKLQGNIVSWGTHDATGYQENPRLPIKPVIEYNAGGGLFGSPKDYLTFLTCMLNHGKYDGGQILKPETVDLMFNNQLPSGITLEDGDTFGLAWAIENSANEMVRTKGSVYWSGLANSYFSMDKEKDVAIVYFTNFFPYGDKETLDFYRLFEKEIYSNLKTK